MRKPYCLIRPIESHAELADLLYRYMDSGGFLAAGLTPEEESYLKYKISTYFVRVVREDRDLTTIEPSEN